MKNVKPLAGALDQVLRLRGVTFEWKDPAEHAGHTGTLRGFSAQDVEKVIPEWVGADPNGFKTLNTRGLDAMLVESVRTLKAENDALRDRMKALEDKRVASTAGLNGGGLLGFAGLTMLAGALVMSRRREPGQPQR